MDKEEPWRPRAMDPPNEIDSTVPEGDEKETEKKLRSGSSNTSFETSTALIKQPYAPVVVKSSVEGWTLSHRRVAGAACKAGISIGCGLVHWDPALNVGVSAAFVLYESIQAIRDYRNGALNRLGYSTSALDVALRIGKEALGVGVGMLLGTMAGLVIGLTSLPVVGQLIATGVISVGIGFCVGSLLTRYADRAVVRIQIRDKYHYPSNERGAQERFEHLLEGNDDLSSIETCRIVQHYIDYRIASGWEDIYDKEMYQEAGYPIELLPVSLQHFTAVRLQRKWGFLRNHGACKKVFRALMLQHHPDRGGDPALAAQLSADYEIYAFCRQWWSDCSSILTASGNANNSSKKGDETMTIKKSIWNIIRKFFFSPRGNSEDLAQGLHAQNQLMLCEASAMASRCTPSPANSSSASVTAISRASENDSDSRQNGTAFLESVKAPVQGENSDASDEEEDSGDSVSHQLGLSFAEQMAAISRVLDGVMRQYSHTVEMINYVSLLRISKHDTVWKTALENAETFSRMQSILHCCETSSLARETRPVLLVHWGAENMQIKSNSETTLPNTESEMFNITPDALSFENVMQQRETAKQFLVSTIFTEQIKNTLMEALELWRAANELVTNFMWAQTASVGETTGEDAEGSVHQNLHSKDRSSGNFAKRVMDTLLRIQSKLNSIVEDELSEWVDYEKRHEDSFLQEIKILGLSASCALGGEHAMIVRESVLDLCQGYIRSWARKQTTFQNFGGEVDLIQAQKATLSSHFSTSSIKKMKESPSKVTCDTPPENFQEKLASHNVTTATHISDFQLLKQQLSEVDQQFQEVQTIDLCFLPEYREELNSFPSTVLWGILFGEQISLLQENSERQTSTNSTAIDFLESFSFPRFWPFERELHLSFFEDMKQEPGNPLEPYSLAASGTSSASRTNPNAVAATDGQGFLSSSYVQFQGCVKFQLWRATKVHPKTGSRSFCWLKQYDFRNVDTLCVEEKAHTDNQKENGLKNNTEQQEHKMKFRKREVQTQLLKKLMKEELSCASKCYSSRVVCPQEVFSESKTCSVYFILPRERTQQRFRSVKNVLTHIRTIGLFWLHEALQCILDLHSSSCSHGNVTLSSFTYDSFGHVSLALFSPSSCISCSCISFSPSTHEEKDEASALKLEQDATDFGIMILSEVLPFLGIRNEETPCNGSDLRESDELHVFRIFKEIGERLVAKVEPRFTLPYARAFVKRCMQIPNSFTVTREKKQVNYFPIEWGRTTYTNHMHLEPVRCIPRFLGVNNKSFLFRRVNMYRNVNPFLWERYARYRDEVSCSNPPPPPHQVYECQQFLFCGDDTEVNERFLWCVCESEAEVWSLAYYGIPKENSTQSTKEKSFVRLPFLSLSNPFKWVERSLESKSVESNLFIAIFRVALGTISDTQELEKKSFVIGGEKKTQLFHTYEKEFGVDQLSVIPSCVNAVYLELVLKF